MRIPSTLRLIPAALIALLVVAGCAGETGAQWTFAPVAIAEEAPADAAAEPGAEASAEAAPAESVASAPPAGPADASMAPMEPAAAGSGAPGSPAAPSGEARVIELVATGALQFTDPAGNQVRDIPLTPGETVTFRVDNTAGFDHNFYIGTDEQLMSPSATTEVGIPTWQSGVQELTWTVPADLTGLKFGCTVPGHYALMQGTFSVSA